MAADQCPLSLQVTSTHEPVNLVPAVVAAADAHVRRFVVCCVCGDLLNNPQLLDCLHSCCAHCSSAAAVSSAVKDGSDGGFVRCPICLEATATQRLRRNEYAAAQAAMQRLDALTAVCGVCSTDDAGNSEQAKISSNIVVKWCSRCDMHLCLGCSVWHDRFQKHPRAVVSRAEANDGSSRPRLWQLLMPVACSVHGAARDAEFYCSDCRCFACAECVRRCIGAGHSMEVAVAASHDERTGSGSQFRGRIAAEVDSVCAALESMRPLLRRHTIDLITDIKAAWAADRERLEERRREALQLIASAFDRAAVELDAIFDGVCTEAADLRDRAAALEAKAEHAAAYWSELREAAGATCLIGQQELVRARMRALADSAAALPPTLECDRLTVIGRQETRRADLDKIVAEWIGSPQPLKGSFVDVLIKGACEVPGSNAGHPEDNSTTSTADRTARAAPTSLEEALRCEDTSAAVSFPVLPDCRDVTCTADGRLLVAALHEGLLQFDLPSGRQLKTWRPAPRWDGNQDSINVVAALDDGRVLIGDAGNDAIVLLRRDGDESWLECRRLFPGHGPWSVAVCGALAAVSSSFVKHVHKDTTNSYSVVGVQCSPGSRLTLLSLDTGRKQRELALEYNISAVALSSSAVVCASQYAEQRAFQADASFIDCYAHDGQRQWRHPFSELVTSVLVVPLAGVVYASLPSSAMVVALSAADGEVLCDVLAQSRHGLAPPRALALCPVSGEGERCKPSVALAVLSFIVDKVALYRLAPA